MRRVGYGQSQSERIPGQAAAGDDPPGVANLLSALEIARLVRLSATAARSALPTWEASPLPRSLLPCQSADRRFRPTGSSAGRLLNDPGGRPPRQGGVTNSDRRLLIFDASPCEAFPMRAHPSPSAEGITRGVAQEPVAYTAPAEGGVVQVRSQKLLPRRGLGMFSPSDSSNSLRLG